MWSYFEYISHQSTGNSLPTPCWEWPYFECLSHLPSFDYAFKVRWEWPYFECLSHPEHKDWMSERVGNGLILNASPTILCINLLI